jgi:ATP-dependent DNA helicase RecQ
VPEGVDPNLLSALKALRRTLAQADGVPAFVVFSDRTLIGMAAMRPTTLEALADVHGVGAKKLDTYGDAFLRVLREHSQGGRMEGAR